MKTNRNCIKLNVRSNSSSSSLPIKDDRIAMTQFFSPPSIPSLGPSPPSISLHHSTSILSLIQLPFLLPTCSSRSLSVCLSRSVSPDYLHISLQFVFP